MAFFSRPQVSNSAIKIVAPDPQEDKSKLQTPKKDSTQRQCRNVLIYGSCKFQDKGCHYYHPPIETYPTTPTAVPGISTGLSAEAVNAPVFVPKGAANSLSPTLTASSTTAASPPPIDYQSNDQYNPYISTDSVDSVNVGGMPLDGIGYSQDFHQSPYVEGELPMNGFYASSQAAFARQPLNYHLYTRPIDGSNSHFLSDSLRDELQKRAEVTQTSVGPSMGLPEELQGYHSLTPLEETSGERRKVFSWYSTVYRAINSVDGVAYVLRRIENYRLAQSSAFSSIEAWSRIRHPNIVRLREAFTTRAFNDNSLVVVYDYHPNAQTLQDAHLKAKPVAYHRSRSASVLPDPVSEAALWSYIAQIASAIKTVHEAGLAVRILDPSKILLYGRNRVRLGSCGIVDVLMHDTRQDIAALQQEDFIMFGRLIFALCCGTTAAISSLAKAVEALSRYYSNDIKSIALYLVSKPGNPKNIAQVLDMVGRPRLVREMDELHTAVDFIEGELMSELENGRLFRLMCKLGFINERPEFAHEPRWSETGDRYIIKLFRDYVFHQVDENGNPVLNMSHVLSCLNKLDSGVEERIMLVSRDEQSCLVVSYKEVKACIDSTFNELVRGLS